jgi:C1A family cysteine protease
MKFALLAGAAAAHNLTEGVMTTEEYEFMGFVSSYGRSYATKAEYNFRLAQFTKRVAEHKRWNAMPGQTSTQGVNHLTDRTDDEIKMLNGFKQMPHEAEDRTKVLEETNAGPIDWRTKGAVTPVKDQGHCGSCWSFSTTGSMEGAHFIKTGELLSLSESNLVDCSWLNHGCNGGMYTFAYMYAESNPLETEAEYPYVAKSGLFACKYKKAEGKVSVKTYHNVTSRSSAQLKAALQNQPVSVAVQADQPVFHQYTGGVVTSDACGTSLDHAILAVGWGTDPTAGDYYIVKNSWTTGWGEQGYIRIGIKDGAGVCGIQEQPAYPETI